MYVKLYPVIVTNGKHKNPTHGTLFMIIVYSNTHMDPLVYFISYIFLYISVWHRL